MIRSSEDHALQTLMKAERVLCEGLQYVAAFVSYEEDWTYETHPLQRLPRTAKASLSALTDKLPALDNMLPSEQTLRASLQHGCFSRLESIY